MHALRNEKLLCALPTVPFPGQDHGQHAYGGACLGKSEAQRALHKSIATKPGKGLDDLSSFPRRVQAIFFHYFCGILPQDFPSIACFPEWLESEAETAKAAGDDRLYRLTEAGRLQALGGRDADV